MTVFPSLPAENEGLAALERRAATRRAVQPRATPQAADRLTQIRKQWPHLQPGLAAALAASPIDLASPELEQIARASAKKKQKSGLGWHSIGEVVSAGAKVADTALGGIDEAIAPVAKAGARGVALGAQSLYEEAQGVVRNVASYDPGGIPVGAAVAGGLTAAALIASAPVSATGAVVAGAVAGGAALGAAAGSQVEGDARWELQSSGGVALERFMRGDRVELGSGWLPNTMAGEDAENPDATFTIGEEQRQRARRITIGGKSLTPGRLLTAGVVQPGSQPYNILSGLVDASVALSRFDPASAGLKAAGNINRNRKLFTPGLLEAGGLLSNRPQIIPEAAQAWWTGATDLRATLTADDDFYSIWKATGGKLGAKLTADVANAKTEQEVSELILPHLGAEIRGKFGYDTFKPLSNVRLLQTMPGTHFDPFDADDAVVTLERWMKNAKLDEDTIGRVTRMAAEANSRNGRRAALDAAMEATRETLVKAGVDKDKAAKLTKWSELASEETSAFWKSATYEDINVPGMYLEGQVTGTTNPHLPSEMINRTITLPDLAEQRTIRTITGMAAPILNSGLVKEGTAVADFLQGQVWKRTALLRGAYTVRVIAEEQVRMAASGLDSLINHPLSLIAMRIGDDSKLGRAMDRGAKRIAGSKVDEDFIGGRFEYADDEDLVGGLDQFNQSLNRGFAGWIDTNVRTLPIWTRTRKGDDEFVSALAGQLLHYSRDPLMREVARNPQDLAGIKASFWDGPLKNVRTNMAESAGGLLDREIADRYIDSILDRLQQHTAGQSDLIEAVATGRIMGSDIRKGTQPSKELKQYLDDFQVNLPDDFQIKRQMTVAERGAGQKLDQITKYLFANLMGERTNNLSRSPAFKQFYAQRIEELVPWMDDAAQRNAVAWAKKNGLDDVATRVSDMAAKRAKAGELNAEQIDLLAKGFALDETQTLLFDMTKKSQFFDATRLIFPFGEAWMEMIKTWGKIGMERPQILARRAPQIITGMRSADPDGDGKGFFYKNENGEEVFAYPAAGWVSEKLFGVEVPMTGRVAGLSLMTDVLPGVGPAVQVPAAALLPDAPEWDWAKDVLFPFGETETQGGFLEAFLPAWVQKFRQAGLTPFGKDETQWNGTVMDVARYLTSTGDYDDIADPSERMQRILEDARAKAKYVYTLRGAAQFFAPTAPTPEWLVHDKNGDGVVAQKLVEEYQKLLKADPQNATDLFFDKFGKQAFLLLQGKSAEVVAGAPVTKEGANWERSNGEIVKDYENVFGFFAPGAGGDLDSAAFQRQMDKGRRVPLTPEQAMKLANGRVANAIYQNAREKVGPSANAAQREWLRSLKKILVEQYPGYTDSAGVPEKASLDILVGELQDAAQDPRLEGNPVQQALRLYLTAREKAAAAGDTETSFRASKALAAQRAWLRQLGSLLVQRYPEFEPVWSRVFDRELADETAEESAA